MESDSEQHAVPFEEVFRQELECIAESREARQGRAQREASALDKELVGVALSGGGVRSATFDLGVLQGLAKYGLLSRVDYLSCTGGGSNVAGWLLTWIRSSGYQEVENQLKVKAGAAEAPEIQGLRQSTVAPLRRGLSSASSAAPVWMRNVALNVLALTAMLAAAILLSKVLLDALSAKAIPTAYAPACALACGVLLGILSRRADRPPSPRPARPRLFWIAVALCLAAAAISSPLISWWWFASDRWMTSMGVLAVLCLLSWIPRPMSWKILSVHVISAAAAGVAGGLLLLLVNPLYWILGDMRVSYADPFDSVWLHRLGGPLTAFCGVASILLYTLLMSRWTSREARELFWRFCRSVYTLSALWLLVAVIWVAPPQPVTLLVWLMVVLGLVGGGLLKAGGVQGQSPQAKFLISMLERLAPYAFVFGLTATVAWLLNIFSEGEPRDITLIAFILLAVAAGLLWGIRVSGFNLHNFHRTLIARNYLAPAASSSNKPTEDGDVSLGELSDLAARQAPYPIFGAALDVADLAQVGPSQGHTVAAFFSPLFSGFDSKRKPAPGGAYRPTQKLGGGISLAGAMAISQPLRHRLLRAPSAAVAMLWTIFDVRDGRFMGNPVRDDTWRKKGPPVEVLYALREGFGDLAGEAAYVRPGPGQEFDNLGLYQLVKRHCRFIIACDATSDPNYAFEDLGGTIRRCRTELGVEIQMDLGPLVRTPATSGAHSQIALIRYPEGEEGLMVYIKPSLTGDEPLDLVQYARTHPQFPSANNADGKFGESDFECYRQLGQHIIESLMGNVQISPETPTSQVFRLIRGQLQPDFTEPETVSASAAAVAPVAPPQELVDAIASGQCLLYAGPGLAAQAKLPIWPAFLDGLLRAAREEGIIDAASAAGLVATLAAAELDAVADELTHQVPREFLLSYVRSATAASEPSHVHRLLAEMKFLGALNTNFDEILGAAFDRKVFVPAEAEKLVAALQSKQPFVANVFGTASQPSSLLFTLKEFRSLLSTNLQFKQFLNTLFLRYTVFFVGCSIDGIRDYLEALELPQTSDRRHYAIVANSGQLDPVKLRFLERSYNVSVIDFQPQFNFAGLGSFLERLQAEVQEKEPRAKSSGAMILKCVTLENIGPFSSLHLDLRPSWNLLLGDNGVGKTVLLKAIAAALCGEKADPPAVTRLLRAGTSAGSIRLKVEDTEYKVKLKRDDDGKVRIESASLSPIKSDNWLVLGFPALRSIPWDRPKGPSAPKPEAPSADDLLPILRGEPDERIADLKQWLVNLDWASAREPSPSRSKKLFNDFFEILQRLTPGLRLRPGRIDQKTLEITVETDAGLVPLESISQGTGSVMCWIGTLLERLAETNNMRDAGQNRALVLIDELDAHMHPKWQQMFVSAFREQFKSVQIIATTHSPLLVGSLKPEEVWLVHRAPLKSDIYGVARFEKAADDALEIVVLGPEDDEEDGSQAPAPREERRYRVPQGAKLRIKDGQVVEEGEPLTENDVQIIAETMNVTQEGRRADQILTGPLFNLETTRDPETERLLSEYTRLTASDGLSTEEENALAEVAGRLNVRIPAPLEKEAAQQAYRLIHDFASERLKALPPAERQDVLDEVKVQITESITGSRRPE
jgi:hypothetical protein